MISRNLRNHFLILILLNTSLRQCLKGCNIFQIACRLVRFRTLTLFWMGFFGAAHGWVAGVGWGAKRSPLSKNCQTYPTLIKLGTVIPYLKKIQKIHKSHDTPWVLLTSAFFHRKSTIFSISGNTSIDCILMHIF